MRMSVVRSMRPVTGAPSRYVMDLPVPGEGGSLAARSNRLICAAVLALPAWVQLALVAALRVDTGVRCALAWIMRDAPTGRGHSFSRMHDQPGFRCQDCGHKVVFSQDPVVVPPERATGRDSVTYVWPTLSQELDDVATETLPLCSGPRQPAGTWTR